MTPARVPGYNSAMGKRDSRISGSRNTDRTQAAEAPAPGKAREGCLVVIHGGDLGRWTRLESGRVVIGRSPDTDIPINQTSVSRHHCEIHSDGQHYKLKDLGSTNRTYLNDQPVIEAWLTDGDHITVGKTILKFVGPGNLEAQYHSRIHQRTVRDSLTGAFNRRHFLELFAGEIARARRHGRVFSLCIMDIDHFKRYNDELGHLAGDGILRELCVVVRQRIRENDVAARIGGEEFALLLPETRLADAEALADALREAVGEHRFVVDSHDVSVTVSLGCAQWHEGMHRPNELIRLADTALYQAKREGRNRVCKVA